MIHIDKFIQMYHAYFGKFPAEEMAVIDTWKKFVSQIPDDRIDLLFDKLSQSMPDNRSYPHLKDFKRVYWKFNIRESDSRTWLEQEWDKWAEKHGCNVDSVKGYQLWVLEASYKINKMPWDLPEHSKHLTETERDVLDIPCNNERLNMFKRAKQVAGGMVL